MEFENSSEVNSYPSVSEQELDLLAKAWAKDLKPGDLVFLHGPLGAGKSTFVRSVLEALEIDRAPEGSPTFAVMHEYHYPSGRVDHLDLYRIEAETELWDRGIAGNLLEDRQALILIEWPDRCPEFCRSLIEKTHANKARVFQVKLDIVSEALRDVEVRECHSPRGGLCTR